MGNPTTIFTDPNTGQNTITYVNSTIFGNFQVEFDSAWPWKTVDYTRTPGVSPAFQEACSFTVFTPNVSMTTTIMMNSQMTTWTKLSLRISPLHQDWWKASVLILGYLPRTTQNNFASEYITGVYNGPSIDTELLIKNIRIYAIKFKP